MLSLVALSIRPGDLRLEEGSSDDLAALRPALCVAGRRAPPSSRSTEGR